jgi:hypothetical protein
MVVAGSPQRGSVVPQLTVRPQFEFQIVQALNGAPAKMGRLTRSLSTQIVRLAHITAATALARGRDPKWSGRAQVTAVGKILTQGRLNHCRKRWAGIVSFDVSLDGLFEIIR